MSHVTLAAIIGTTSTTPAAYLWCQVTATHRKIGCHKCHLQVPDLQMSCSYRVLATLLEDRVPTDRASKTFVLYVLSMEAEAYCSSLIMFNWWRTILSSLHKPFKEKMFWHPAHWFHLQVPDLPICCNDLTAMKGYHNNSQCNGCQVTGPIIQSPLYSLKQTKLWCSDFMLLIWQVCTQLTVHMYVKTTPAEVLFQSVFRSSAGAILTPNPRHKQCWL